MKRIIEPLIIQVTLGNIDRRCVVFGDSRVVVVMLGVFGNRRRFESVGWRYGPSGLFMTLGLHGCMPHHIRRSYVVYKFDKVSASLFFHLVTTIFNLVA